MRRLGEPELVDEDLGELVVPVLAGMDDDLLDPRVAKRLGQGRRLDELRAVADDGEDAHAPSVERRASSPSPPLPIPTSRLVPRSSEEPPSEG